MKYLYQIKTTKAYKGFSYCFFSDEHATPSYIQGKAINFYMKDQFITSVHLCETEYIKQYDEAGKLVQIVYEEDKIQ